MRHVIKNLPHGSDSAYSFNTKNLLKRVGQNYDYKQIIITNFPHRFDCIILPVALTQIVSKLDEELRGGQLVAMDTADELHFRGVGFAVSPVVGEFDDAEITPLLRLTNAGKRGKVSM